MRLTLIVFCMLVMSGCAITPYKIQADYNVTAKPKVCENFNLYGADNADDDYYDVQKIWTEFNALYKGKNRKIAVFLDGTANTKKDSSNVRILYRMALAKACEGTPVIPYYDKGVGSNALDLIGAGAGRGVGLNIRQAYRFIASAYAPGDEIYIFGFSRGAFEARSLNGFIEFSGLLDTKSIPSKWTDYLPRWLGSSSLHFIVEDIYDQYRVNDNGTKSFEADLRNRINAYKKNEYGELSFVDVKVEAIGVFDTVPALGFFSDEEPDNHRMDLYAKKGFHALSIDEQRSKFKLNRFDPAKIKGELIEVWFPGVHADVGGGYAKQIGCNIRYDKRTDRDIYVGLEVAPLLWMLNNFKEYNIFVDLDKSIKECGDAALHDEVFDGMKLYKALGLNKRKPAFKDHIHESVSIRTKSSCSDSVQYLKSPHLERECCNKVNNICIASEYKPENLRFPLSYYDVVKTGDKIEPIKP